MRGYGLTGRPACGDFGSTFVIRHTKTVSCRAHAVCACWRRHLFGHWAEPLSEEVAQAGEEGFCAPASIEFSVAPFPARRHVDVGLPPGAGGVGAV